MNAKSYNLMTEIETLDAGEMEDLLLEMAEYFKASSDTVTNFDANEVANKLAAAARIVRNRTGN